MIHNRQVTALVPIRVTGGEADNNLKNFCGLPLYEYIIKTLHNTYAVDAIIVNTNSSELAEKVADLSEKITTVMRPIELDADDVDINQIIEFDVENNPSDIYVQTHVTNPLLRAETIALALKDFLSSEETNDSLFSVNRYKKRFYDTHGIPLNHDPENLVPTQQLEPVYEENSILYIFTKSAFVKRKNRIGLKPKMYAIPSIEAIDINDEISFRFAEILALYKK